MIAVAKEANSTNGQVTPGGAGEPTDGSDRAAEQDLRAVRNKIGQVDPAQAARAVADVASWRSAKVVSVRGRLIEVSFDGEDDQAVIFMSGMANSVGRGSEVLISEPHGMLSCGGSPVELDPPAGDEPPSEPTMISVRRVPDEFVYGHVGGMDYEYFYIVPRAEAEEAADVMELMSTCHTWGELREQASPVRFEEILYYSGFGEFDDFTWHLEIGRPLPGVYAEAAEVWEEQQEHGLPEDHDRFDPYKIDSFHSADWPTPLARTQCESLPDEVVWAFGRSYETSINGTYAEIRPEEGLEAVAMMEELGFRCVEDTELLDVVPSGWMSF